LANKMIGEGISEEQKSLMEEIKDITAPPTPPAPVGAPVAKSATTKKKVTVVK
jgi:hypothetical protein